MSAMKRHRNYSYRIVTELVRPGVIRARALGAIRNQRTTATSSHAEAAAALAHQIEGDRFAEVVMNLQGATSREYAVYVNLARTTPTAERRAAALAEAQAENEAARAARPELIDPTPWDHDAWHMLGGLLGTMQANGVIHVDDWNSAAQAAAAWKHSRG